MDCDSEVDSEADADSGIDPGSGSVPKYQRGHHFPEKKLRLDLVTSDLDLPGIPNMTLRLL